MKRLRTRFTALAVLSVYLLFAGAGALAACPCCQVSPCSHNEPRSHDCMDSHSETPIHACQHHDDSNAQGQTVSHGPCQCSILIPGTRPYVPSALENGAVVGLEVSATVDSLSPVVSAKPHTGDPPLTKLPLNSALNCIRTVFLLI